MNDDSTKMMTTGKPEPKIESALLANGSTDDRKSVKPEPDDVPVWFMRIFIIMMILTIASIWFIPQDTLLRWSMWWNNIPHN